MKKLYTFLLSLCLSIILVNTAVASDLDDCEGWHSVVASQIPPQYPVNWHDKVPQHLDLPEKKITGNQVVEISPQQPRIKSFTSSICKIVFAVLNDGNLKIQVWDDTPSFDTKTKQALDGRIISYGTYECLGRVCIYQSNRGYESQFIAAMANYIGEALVVDYLKNLLTLYQK